MAIYQRDRDFYRLFSQIDIDVVPLKFVKTITCILGDGSKIVLHQSDFSEQAEQGQHTAQLINSLSFHERMTDVGIHIDYNRVQESVVLKVTNLLSINPNK